MNKEELLNLIQEAGTTEDEAERRVKLAELSDSVSDLYDKDTKLEESVKNLEERNEKLREANMELFTRVGIQKDPEEETGTDEDPEEPERRKFDDLFNEKGELK